jgi:hypothetical protein
LAIRKETGYRQGEGNVLWKMSLVLDKLGERIQAKDCIESALRICEEIESPDTEKVRETLKGWPV